MWVLVLALTFKQLWELELTISKDFELASPFVKGNINVYLVKPHSRYYKMSNHIVGTQ